MKIKHIEILGKDLSSDELLEALKVMKKDSAPGPDGLIVSFYSVFWKKLALILRQSYMFAFNQGRLSHSQRRGVVRLIPKKNKNLLAVTNWRPITLLNVDYKILSKSLALRLSAVLLDLIGSGQRGFIKNRYIGDNVYKLYSIISQAESEQQEGVLLQLDIENAFDSVSWNYLMEVLNNFSFPSSFMDWVTTLYFNKELRIMNNGRVLDPIHPTNGLAQGDGLSPLLFVLVIETLALTLHNNDKIEGYKVNSIHKKLALLADDMILSLKAKQSTFKEVLETLTQFSKISNLHVNAAKSAVFPIGPKRSAKNTLDISPFKWSDSSDCDYLGIMVIIKSIIKQVIIKQSSQKHFGMGILHHIDSITAPRNSTEHSLLGRILNVKVFIASKLNYYFALAPAPPLQILNSAQSHINKYIWSYGIHHITANLLYKPFDTGGLNHYSIVNHNIKAKLSALNKLSCNSQEYWQQYLANMFKLPFNILLKANMLHKDLSKVIKKGYVLPLFWRYALLEWSKVNFQKIDKCSKNSLVICNSLLNTCIAFDIEELLLLYNSGIRTFEDFLSSTNQSPMVPRAVIQIKTVFDVSQFANSSPVCDLTIPISAWAIGEFILSLNQEKPQKIWVQWAQDTLYLPLASEWHKICALRHSFVSIRFQAFYWHFINRAICTNIRLSKFNSKFSPLCTFCSLKEEMFIHLFWECNLVQELWQKLIRWCCLYIDSGFNYDRTTCLLTGSQSKPVLSNVFLCCKYFIHIQHFKQAAPHFPNLIRVIKSVHSKDYNAFSNLSYLYTKDVSKHWSHISSDAFA